MMKKITCFLWLGMSFFLCLHIVKAQPMRYSQAYVMSSYTNPALTGSGDQLRGSLLHRNQWSGLAGSLLTTGASFEFSNIADSFGGGLIFSQNKSTNLFKQIETGLALRKTVSFSEKSGLSLGVMALYGMYQIDKSGLVFGDQLQKNGAISAVTAENAQGIMNRAYLNLGAGLTYYADKFFVGVSAKYLNRPNMAVLARSEYKQPFLGNVFFSFDLPVTLFGVPFMAPNEKVDLQLKPFIMYELFNGFSVLDFGCYVVSEPFLFGLKYRGLSFGDENEYNWNNHDALSFMLGYELDKISFVYSYDLIFTNISSAGGTHELGIVFRKPLEGAKRVYF